MVEFWDMHFTCSYQHSGNVQKSPSPHLLKTSESNSPPKDANMPPTRNIAITGWCRKDHGILPPVIADRIWSISTLTPPIPPANPARSANFHR